MAKGLNQQRVTVDLNFNTDNAKKLLVDLLNQLKFLSTNAETIKMKVDLDDSSLKTATAQIDSLSAHLKSAINPLTGNLDFAKFNNSLLQSNINLLNYARSLLELGPDGQKAFTQLTHAIATAEVPTRRFLGLLGNFGTVLGNTIRWLAASSAIHGIMGSIQGAYTYALNLNESLNRILIVTLANDLHMAAFAKSANEAAKALSTTTTAYTDASLIFYQLGLNDKLVAERTNATIKLANITGLAVETVSNQLTAIWNNFDDGTKNLEYYADVITALGAATASSSEEISKGLAKFAPIGETIGLSYESASAALATIIATTRQSADSVGTGLRTVFSRLSSLGLGETLEDGVTLTKYSKALLKVGVDVLKANGELREMDDILNDLGDKWGLLDKAQLTALAQTIGGVRQYTNIMALMNNYDFYKENLDIAKNSEGTVLKLADIYAQSWEASQKRVRASAEAIFDNLINDKFFIGLNNAFSKVLDFTNKIIDGFGGLKGVILGVGALATTVFRNNISLGLMKAGTSLIDGFRSPEYWQRLRSTMLLSLANTASDYGTRSGISNKDLNRYVLNQDWFARNLQWLSPALQQEFLQRLESFNSIWLKSEEATQRLRETTDLRSKLGGHLYTAAMTEAAVSDEAIARNENVLNARKYVDQYKEQIASGKYSLEESGLDGNTRRAIGKLINDGFISVTKDMVKAVGLTTFEQYQDDFNVRLKNLANKDFWLNNEESLDYQDLAKRIENYSLLDELGKFLANQYFLKMGLTNPSILKAIQNGAPVSMDDVRLSIISSTLTDIAGHYKNISVELVEEYLEALKTEGTDSEKVQELRKKLKENLDDEERQQLNTLLLGLIARQATATASGLMSLGMAFTNLNSIMGQWSEVAMGNQKAGTALILTMTTLPMTITSMTNAAKGLNEAFEGLNLPGITGLIATAGVALITLVSRGIDNFSISAEEHIQNVRTAAEVNKLYADQVRSNYDSLLNNFESYQKLLSELNDYQYGTVEWQLAMLNANKTANSIISDNNLQLGTDYELASNGMILFRTNLQNDLTKNFVKSIESADIGAAITEAMAQTTIDQEDLSAILDRQLYVLTEIQSMYGNKNEYASPYAWLENELARERIAADKELNDYARLIGVSTERLFTMSAAEIQSGLLNNSTQSIAARNMAVNALMAKKGQKTNLDELVASTLVNDIGLWDEITNTNQVFILGKGNVKIEGGTLTQAGNLKERQKTFKALFSKAEYDALTDELKLSEEFLRSRILAAVTEQKLETELANRREAANTAYAKEFANYKNLTRQEILDLETRYELSEEKNGKYGDVLDQYAQDVLNRLMLAEANVRFLSNSLLTGTAEQDLTKAFLELATLRQTLLLGDVTEKYMSAYGEEFGTYIYSTLRSDLLKNNYSFALALEDFVPSGNILTDLVAWRNNENLSDELKETLINKARSSAGGNAGILNLLYSTEAFSNLRDEFEKTGELEADTILKAADASEELAEYLKDSTVNAQGLADAIKLIETDKLNISLMSNALIEALSVAGLAANGLATTYNFMDSYETERSVKDIGSFWKKRGKEITSMMGSAFLTDAPGMLALTAMFGEETANVYRKRAAELDNGDYSFKEILRILKDEFSTNLDLISSIQKNGDLRGVFDYLLNNGASTQNYSNVFTSKNGSIYTNEEALAKLLTDQYGSMSFENFVKYLKDGGLSLELAEATASEYVSTNIHLGQQFRKTGAAQGLKTLFNSDNLNADLIRAFYSQYSDVIDKLNRTELTDIFGTSIYLSILNVNDLLNITKDAAQALGKSFIDLGANFNYSKTDLDELNNALIKNNNEFRAGENALLKYLNTNKNGSIDLNRTVKDLEKLGYSTELAYDIINEMSDTGDYFKSLSVSVRNANGQMLEFDSSLEAWGEDLSEIIDVEAIDTFKEFLAKNPDLVGDNTRAIKAWQESIQEALSRLTAISDMVTAIQTALGSIEMNIDIGSFDFAGFSTRLSDAVSSAFKNGLNSLNKGPGGKSYWQEFFDQWMNYQQNQANNSSNNGSTGGASGYNNIKGFAGGKHSNGQFEGIAIVGELGPELWVHNGEPMIVGKHGRAKVYLRPDDLIFTASQTREILRDNPELLDLPGFAPGSPGYINKEGGSSKKDEGHERYHLANRLLLVLEKIYEQLTKIRENSYGTNILESIDRQIEATQKLLERNQELKVEVKDYLGEDALKLKDLLGDEFLIDENGNLTNAEELMRKYTSDKAKKKKKSKDIIEALTQYEETLDKYQEVSDTILELIYQIAELELERITAKVDMLVKFDDKDIKLLDHELKNIDDDIYSSAEVLDLTATKMAKINDKISVTRKGMENILLNLTDSEGKLITKEDGTAYTIEEWLALSAAERDALDINGAFGELLEEYTDNLLDCAEELDDLKTKGIEELSDAFDELSDDIKDQMDLYEHYNNLLSTTKDIVELLGRSMNTLMRQNRALINSGLFDNIRNELASLQASYSALIEEIAWTESYMETIKDADPLLYKEYEDFLDNLKKSANDQEEEILSLWQQGLSLLKDAFSLTLEDIVYEYEKSISGIYGTMDDLQDAYNRQKDIDDYYVDDYERYYQISKLLRSITTDLENAAKAGNKQNQRMKQLYNELNDARASGVELTEYDLDIFEKRYEYEKALMELEDARNNKSEVRLHRDANGNWGYVYTAGLDEDALSQAELNVEDAFYALLKATQEQIPLVTESIMNLMAETAKGLQEMYENGASPEAIEEYMNSLILLLSYYKGNLEKALADAGDTTGKAIELYAANTFNIYDLFIETLLNRVSGGDGSLDDLFTKITDGFMQTNNDMLAAAQILEENQDGINSMFELNEDGSAKILTIFSDISGWIESLGTLSADNMEETEKVIKNAKDTYEEILDAAMDFEDLFMDIYSPVIDKNEEFIEVMLEALGLLNRLEIEGPGHEIGEDIAALLEEYFAAHPKTTGSGRLRRLEADNDAMENYDNQKLNELAEQSMDAAYNYALQIGSYTAPTLAVEMGTNYLKKKYGPLYNEFKKRGELFKTGGYTGNWPVSAATGMYTGTWNGLNIEANGRLAFLHQKEQVFNATDTQKLLDAAKIVRMIDLSAATYATGLGILNSPAIGTSGQVIDLNVTITASFPNATDHNEIEQAFTNLINNASQYANRKDMSSRTFQDAYTSTT